MTPFPLTSAAITARHGFFTRQGGVSTGPYASLNCALSGQDDPAHVAENRARVTRALGATMLLGLHQVHGADVVTVAEPWQPGQGPRADAMVTAVPGLALGIITADCTPVLLHDRTAGVVGAVHAGWRSALGGVLEATVDAMLALGATPAGITAAIGPSIRQASYEVGADLRDAVLARSGADERFFKPGRPDHWQFDLAGYCAGRMAGLGQVDTLDADTLPDEARFYSHRRRTLAGGGPIGHQIKRDRAVKRLLLLLLLPLAACGGLPQPFFNNPGLAGLRLSEPPAARLAVPVPGQSLLPDAAAETWARATADALVEQEIPAAASGAPAPRAKEWTLRLSAELRGDSVIPSYTVLNPGGVSQGSSEGKPVPARAWAAADPATLKAAADQAAPGIATLLNTIEAARRQSDPNSLVNRPARIYLAGVTGAPGDGGRSLPEQMRLKLIAQGLVVQDTPANADYKVEADVQTAPGANGTVRVELQWIVSDARSERGRIVQINEVPPRTISPYWGDVAVAAATEAAAGVRQVITNASGISPKKL